MANQYKVKLAQVTNLSDARFAAAAGFDYLSFCFNPQQHSFIPPVKAKEIIDWVTGPYIVGEFGNQSPDEINDMTDLLNLDLIEVENSLLPDEVEQLQKPVIKKINLDHFSADKLLREVEAYKKVCAGFTFILNNNQLKQLKDISGVLQGSDFFLGGTEDAALMHEWCTVLHASGIHITGSKEEMVGMKDFDKLQEIADRFVIID